MNPPISVCIIGLNEEKKIEDCLKSVIAIADEIIFVDSFSTDKTLSIVNKYTKKIYKKKFIGYTEQKNYAVKKAKNDWILSLDCDERLSTEAVRKIKEEWKLAEKTNNLPAGYTFKRLTYYVYRWIRHSGWYPDEKIRLFDKNCCRWEGLDIHERVSKKENVKKKIKKIDADILHYSFDTISDHIGTLEKFSTIGALEAHKKGKKSGIFIIASRSFWAGFRKFFLEFSFLDGAAGIIITGLSAAATWAKYSKLYILNKQAKEPDFCSKNKIPINIVTHEKSRSMEQTLRVRKIKS
ncbi:MAG: glycosyltransferase family 2 protein [Spirochaetia bacterium]|nr:glycosyltransferase family 2 protein [Spirochaetia bacterium]